MGLFSQIKGWFSNLRRNLKIAETMNTVFRMPPDITELVEVWRDLYRGYATDEDGKQLTGIAALIANDVAKKACSELIITATLGDSDYDLQIFSDDMMIDIRQQVEYALAMGGVVCRPYFDGRKVCFTWYTADRVLPTAWEGRQLVGCVLIDYYEATEGGSTVIYTKLESHGIDKTDGLYHIRSKLFKNFSYDGGSGDYLGTEVPLSTVPDWEGITPDIIIQNPQAPTFVYMGTPFANNKTLNIPIGVSMFKDALPWIKAFDEAFTSITWENDAGKAKLFVSEDMIPQKRMQYANAKGSITVDDLSSIDKQLYKKLITEDADKLFEIWAPTLRFDSYITYLNFLLHSICILSGLDPGQFVFDEKSYAVTAKEIISKQQKTYHTVVDTQRYMVTPMVNKLVACVRQLQQLYRIPQWIPLEVEVNLDFGDSILVDEQQEKQDAMQEVREGVRSKLSYLMTIRHLSEAEAKEELERIKVDQPQYFAEGA